MKSKRNIRDELYKEQQGKCFFCGENFNISELDLDHLSPRSFGGDDTENNIVLSCRMCNMQRSNKVPFREIEFNFFISQIL